MTNLFTIFTSPIHHSIIWNWTRLQISFLKVILDDLCPRWQHLLRLSCQNEADVLPCIESHLDVNI